MKTIKSTGDLAWVRPGARVRHPRYGDGTLCSYLYSHARVRVIFKDAIRTIALHSKRRAAGLSQEALDV